MAVRAMVVIIGIVLLWSGCSTSGPSDGGPTASELEQAIKRALASENKMTRADEEAMRSTKVKKLGCTTTNATDYTCDIEINAAQPSSDGKSTHTMNVPVVKVGNRWVYKDSKEWCEVLMNKPTGQLTGNDMEYYGKCMSKKMN